MQKLSTFEEQGRLDASLDILSQLPAFVGRGVSRVELSNRMPRLLPIVRAWSADKSLLLLGPTGVGKTSAMGWLFRRFVAVGVKHGGDEWRRALGLRWFSATELEHARREHPLGKGEAPELARACVASVLFLDDAGWDKDPKAVSEVMAARYESSLPTVCTSGLDLDGFNRHYGAAVARRLTEAGGKARVVTLHEVKI